nr:MAG TPA: hypothetical protein [Caudoviricetes sp.]
MFHKYLLIAILLVIYTDNTIIRQDITYFYRNICFSILYLTRNLSECKFKNTKELYYAKNSLLSKLSQNYIYTLSYKCMPSMQL